MDTISQLTSGTERSTEWPSHNLIEVLHQSRQQCRWFEQRVKELETELETGNRRIEQLEAENQWLKRRLFGRRSEKQNNSTLSHIDTKDTNGGYHQQFTTQQLNKKRGGQPGHQGHGRKIPTHLPREERLCCPCCGLAAEELPMTEDSYEIDVKVQYVLVVHRRKKYKKICSCPTGSPIITAAPPAKIIPKGKFTADFWAKTIIDKYLLQLPIQRQTLSMQLQGLWVPKSTIIGGFSALESFFSPLYQQLIEISRQQHHWHIDETRWRMFVELEGKNSYNWWLWVFALKLAVCYVLDPLRSKAVPERHLGEDGYGIINADRYGVYKSLSGDFVIAFC